MDIILYVNKDERNKVDKKLSNGTTLSGTLKSETSIISPSIMIEAEDITQYNYCYIPQFKRYYFINNITSVRTGLWRFSCAVDVLMSYASEIKKLPAILENTQDTAGNNYLSDNVWTANVKNVTDILNFPGGLLESGEFILITAGG